MVDQKKIKVGIVGITGYGGIELTRLLLNHPYLDLCYGSSRSHEGKALFEIYPHFKGLVDLVLEPHPTPSSLGGLSGLDAVFLAMPHGESMKLLPHLPQSMKVVDLAADYRLNSIEKFNEYYKMDHQDFKRTGDFVYGLTEVNREEISKAQFVANPGCFATAVQLAIFPFVQDEIVNPTIIVDAKTGSSGSGVSPKATTHHPFRDGSLYAYKLLSHQHLPEIKQTLERIGFESDLLFQVHSAPMVRGIFASCYLELKDTFSEKMIKSVLLDFYKDSPFVRIVDGSPNVNFVRQTNFIDIGFGLSGTKLVVFSALDNLVKGAAGQAIQNMNLMLGQEEDCGLKLAGGFPA